jgi:GTP-binding protein LepA
MNSIRNFCIIAHIDHGKSTLADRLLEITNTISQREYKDQILDNMDLERERVLPLRVMLYRWNIFMPEINIILNLIDTPGHVDFPMKCPELLLPVKDALLVIDSHRGYRHKLYPICIWLSTIIWKSFLSQQDDMPNAMPERS